MINIKMGKNSIGCLLDGFISIYGGIRNDIRKYDMRSGFTILNQLVNELFQMKLV